MLYCNNISKNYFSKMAVRQVTLQLDPGRIYAILGPNGSGKTTLMKMIAGLIKPSTGNITYNDEPIGVESKKRIAYMSTEPFYYNYMSAKDVGKYHEDFFEDFRPERYAELLEKMQLKMSDKVKSLSSGMAAKLKIAATLSRKAELYMLDEPLNGIDIIAREHIITTILEESREDSSLLISSHLVDELEKIIDYAVFMKEGDLVLAGDAEQLRVEKGKSIVDLYKQIYAY